MGHPAFCMVIAVVWHVVVNDPRLRVRRLEIRHWLYVDDWLMQAPLAIAVQLLAAVEAAAAARATSRCSP